VGPQQAQQQQQQQQQAQQQQQQQAQQQQQHAGGPREAAPLDADQTSAARRVVSHLVHANWVYPAQWTPAAAHSGVWVMVNDAKSCLEELSLRNWRWKWSTATKLMEKEDGRVLQARQGRSGQIVLGCHIVTGELKPDEANYKQYYTLLDKREALEHARDPNQRWPYVVTKQRRVYEVSSGLELFAEEQKAHQKVKLLIAGREQYVKLDGKQDMDLSEEVLTTVMALRESGTTDGPVGNSAKRRKREPTPMAPPPPALDAPSALAAKPEPPPPPPPLSATKSEDASTAAVAQPPPIDGPAFRLSGGPNSLAQAASPPPPAISFPHQGSSPRSTTL